MPPSNKNVPSASRSATCAWRRLSIAGRDTQTAPLVSRQTPWPRGIIGRFRLQCRAMFLWADLRELVRHPFSALGAIDARRRLADGLAALGLSLALPAVLSELGALGPFRPPANLGSLPSLTAQGADIYARWVYQNRFVLPLYGLLFSGAVWLLAAGLIHVIARALGGRGDFSGYLKLVGYAAFVGVIALPLAVLDALLKIRGDARPELQVGQLLGLLGLAIFLWQNALLVLAARQHYGLSTERAVAAVVGPIGVVVVLVLALVILAVVFAIISRPAPAL